MHLKECNNFTKTQGTNTVFKYLSNIHLNISSCLHHLSYTNVFSYVCIQQTTSKQQTQPACFDHATYLRTGSGVSMVQSISRICSSWMKCCLQACRMLFFRAQPTGPKSYRPLTPEEHYCMVTECLKTALCVGLRTNRYLNVTVSHAGVTSIDGKGLVIEESPLEGILHLGSINNVIFGL